MRFKLISTAWIGFVFLYSAPRAAADTTPLASAAIFQEILATLNYFDSENRLNGLILEDDTLTEYVRAVGKKVTPETYAGRIDIHVVLDPILNAYAMPNGSIYVHLGLLARLENEAQLAQILAHEITHVTNHHTEEFYRALRSKTHLAELLSMAGTVALNGNSALSNALFDIGLNLLYAASVTGFGRSSEEEADKVGLSLMAKAGYDPREAPKTFEILQKEYGDPGRVENFFYGSHPRCKERVKYLRALVKKDYDTPTGATFFEALHKNALRHFRTDAALNMAQNWPLQAIASLERVGDSAAWDADMFSHYAEAHRLWGKYFDDIEKWKGKKKPQRAKRKKEDAEKDRQIIYGKSRVFYETALSLDSGFSNVLKGLGQLSQDRGDSPAAISWFQKYIEANFEAVDSAYISWKLLDLSGAKDTPETPEEMKLRKKTPVAYHTRFLRMPKKPGRFALMDPSVEFATIYSGHEGVLDEEGVYRIRRKIVRSLQEKLERLSDGPVRVIFREDLSPRERYLYYQARLRVQSELARFQSARKRIPTDGYGIKGLALRLAPDADALVIPYYYGYTISEGLEKKEMFKSVAIIALTGQLQMTIKAQSMLGVAVVDVPSGEILWFNEAYKIIMAEIGQELQINDPSVVWSMMEETFIYPKVSKK